ncbi:MAG: N-acetyltransferase [Candidatus Bathyarchaeota archaeon]
MDRNCETRFFNEKDLADVAHINWTCLPENYDTSFFLDISNHFPRIFLVAMVDGKLVGYIMCRVEVGLSGIKFKIARKGHVISLAVLPEHRRRGIAHALLSKVISNIAEYNVDEFYLEVRIGNKPAIDLYQSFGFTSIRTIRGYYRDGEDACVMSRSID